MLTHKNSQNCKNDLNYSHLAQNTDALGRSLWQNGRSSLPKDYSFHRANGHLVTATPRIRDKDTFKRPSAFVESTANSQQHRLSTDSTGVKPSPKLFHPSETAVELKCRKRDDATKAAVLKRKQQFLRPSLTAADRAISFFRHQST